LVGHLYILISKLTWELRQHQCIMIWFNLMHVYNFFSLLVHVN
jgi:hypothetical protein